MTCDAFQFEKVVNELAYCCDHHNNQNPEPTTSKQQTVPTLILQIFPDE